MQGQLGREAGGQRAADRQLGQWLDYCLRLTPAELRAGRLELAVRAVDVALTVAALTWRGQDLLLHPATGAQLDSAPEVLPPTEPDPGQRRPAHVSS